MYTDYTNNYDTSHIAYPEQLTIEEQETEWSIFAALQPPLEDVTTIASCYHTSTPTNLNTYPILHIPSYIFPTPTSTPTPTSPKEETPKF